MSNEAEIADAQIPVNGATGIPEYASPAAPVETVAPRYELRKNRKRPDYLGAYVP